jgi:hypothetical protein
MMEVNLKMNRLVKNTDPGVKKTARLKSLRRLRQAGSCNAERNACHPEA